MARKFKCRATDINFTVLAEDVVEGEAPVEGWKVEVLADHPGAVLMTWEVDDAGEPVGEIGMPDGEV